MPHSIYVANHLHVHWSLICRNVDTVERFYSQNFLIFIDQFPFENIISPRPPYLRGFQEHDKRQVFETKTALVQEQVYAWVIASSFVKLLEAPQVWRMKRYNVLETELV